MRRSSRRASANTKIQPTTISSSTGIRAAPMFGLSAAVRATDSSMVPRSARWWQTSCSKMKLRTGCTSWHDSKQFHVGPEWELTPALALLSLGSASCLCSQVRRGPAKPARQLVWLWRLLNLNHAFRTAGFDLFHPRHHIAGERKQRLRMRRVFSLEYGRHTTVARFANLRIKLDASEVGDVELFRRLFRAAAREDIDFVLAMRAHEVTHVFDHADDVHLHLAEHLDGLARILQRNVGRRRD